ncbi:hypothetical protein HPB51_007344 [Rhipicephalus microplus]|uniref:CAP-Gly domain-containing protein n=1 Tax=Rhipicephalus microplus TaxID=6941 RepID=A0A9J6EYE9_RHIMP|nr:hypothetical protein HPB51_007344 [Rhipicephalus microplus]
MGRLAVRFVAAAETGGPFNHGSADDFIVGDRVWVNGTRPGYIQFLGETQFAAGDWAGVLFNPLSSLRYFRCLPRHGLFAPLHKVAREGGHTSTTTTTTTRTTRITSQPRRAGSQESLRSSLSSASARAGVRLGVAALTSPAKVILPCSLPSYSPFSPLDLCCAFFVALKEKEEHVEQLLKERDLERAEVARAAVQVEESEQQLAALRTEHQCYVEEMEKRAASLHQLLEEHEQERARLNALNSDLQRKVEDLQFRLEEQEILHSDNDTAATAQAEKVSHLERQLQEYKDQLEAAKLQCSAQRREKERREMTSKAADGAVPISPLYCRPEAEPRRLPASATPGVSARSPSRAARGRASCARDAAR